MKLFLAACLVFGAMLLAGFSISALGPRAPGPIQVLVFLLIIGASAWIGMRLFNPAGTHPLGFQSPEAVVAALEQEGLLVSEPYTAVRAFSVEEYDDEGSHYFLELPDGRVLYLSGQYLYDYEPLEEDGASLERRFPCSAFIVRSHRTEGFTVDLVCDGTAFKPEAVLPPFAREAHRSGLVPSDRAVIADRTYDALRLQFSGGV
ncbi:MAG: hypothetical protein IPL90_19570 [Holophagales bacterium]|nr:hypothetical protein [Holophagales bacterium]